MRSLIVTPSPLKVLVILGHPRKDSLCGALADSFVAGARKADVDHQASLDLCELRFNPNVVAGSRNYSRSSRPFARRSNWSWAEHMVFVFPTWWGTMPALMKASSTGC